MKEQHYWSDWQERRTHPESNRPANVLGRPALLRQVGVEIHVLGAQTHALARKEHEGLRRDLVEGEYGRSS